MEVSIDGARGILLNVIGGMDMSMHEINTAAETITAAADPDANIVFGATINPELEGELIITVVATGFDAAYFANRSAAPTDLSSSASTPSVPKPTDDSVIQDIDMQLDGQDKAAKEFQNEKPMPNIWTLDQEEDKDEPQTDTKPTQAFVGGSAEEDELEKPAFLRQSSSFLGRLKNRGHQGDKGDGKDGENDDPSDKAA